jgi:hypothetical protein
MKPIFYKAESRWICAPGGLLDPTECRLIVDELNATGFKIGVYVRLRTGGTIGIVTDIDGCKPVVSFENGIEDTIADSLPATYYEVVSQTAYEAELQANAEYVEECARRNQGASEKWGFVFQEYGG